MSRDAIEAALSSDDDEIRYRAVAAIAGLEDAAEAQALLARCLGDASWRVRKAAIEGLVAQADREGVVARLIVSLSDEENAGARNAAAEALVRLGPASLTGLLGQVGCEDEDLRKFIVDVLGQIGDGAATDALIGRLSDPDDNVRGAAAEALGKIGGAQATEALLATLEGRDLLLTLSALDALVRAGAAVPLERLRPLSTQRLLRRPVLSLLARIDDDEALGWLLDALSDASRGTREAALAALAGWSEAFDRDGVRLDPLLAERDPAPLLAAARDGLAADEIAVRAAAMDIASRTGDAALAPALVEAAEDERLRERVLDAIRRLGPGAAEPLIKSLDRLPPWAVVLALTGLALCDDGGSVPYVVRFLDQDEPEVRQAAVEVLAALGDARAVEPLARLLGRPDKRLAGAVVRALAELATGAREAVLDACRQRLGDPDALRIADACRVLSAAGSPAEVPLLQVVLRHQDPRAREAAAVALGSLPGGEAVAQLRYALADESPQVRAAAARALGVQGGREAADVLLVALKDEEPAVAGAAAEAIGGLGDPALGAHLLPLLGSEEAPGEAAAAYAVVRALRRLDAPEIDVALYRAAAHPEGEVVKEAAAVAADLPGEAGTQVLLACARHDAWDVRRAAARALARRGDPAVLPDLEALLDAEEDAMVAEGFAEAIRLLRGGE
jgi:HEAT repeat protein